jgi:hypothetical protein
MDTTFFDTRSENVLNNLKDEEKNFFLFKLSKVSEYEFYLERGKMRVELIFSHLYYTILRGYARKKQCIFGVQVAVDE